MKILNLGSMNLDHVYQMDHIVKEGETEASYDKKMFLGGKGMNQSVALAKAGADVWQGGMIGNDGKPFLDACKEYGVHSDYIATIDGTSGHAIIQVDRRGQNSILLYGGANQALTEDYVDEVLSHFDSHDILLLQNEINMMAYIVEKAYEKNIMIVLNPSPFNDKLKEVDLQKISMFILNEVEGEQITTKQDPKEILEEMEKMYPHARIVLTLGEDGAYYAEKGERTYQPAYKVNAVDTTAAGDTFTGYFLALIAEGKPVKEALEISAKASSVTVTREGAVPSIPYRNEVII